MKVSLLDVNVLIALGWPSHVHHELAHQWFGAHSSAGWATCALTQCGFVRISSNPKIIPEAVTVQDALSVLRGFVASESHVFWPDDLPLTASEFPSRLMMGHRQVTDAYLLGLAIRHGGQLVTLDRNVSALLSSNSPDRDSLVVIPVE